MNSSLQYYHNREGYEFTAVVDVIDQELFLEGMKAMVCGKIHSIEFMVGTTEVIGGDQYCKRIGREKSLANIKLVTYDRVSISLNKGTIIYKFLPVNLFMPVLTFEIKQGRKRPYLIKVQL